MATRVLEKVIAQGYAFSSALVPTLFPHCNAQSRAFVVYLCFGVLRFYFSLKNYLGTILARPLRTKDQDVELLLLIGLYQIFYTDTPAYAVLNETVQAAQSLKKPWAKGLINALLRKILSEPRVPLSTDNAHPEWLRHALSQAWPDHWPAIVAANQAHPPLTLRVNTRKITVEHYIERLEKNSLSATRLIHCPEGLIVTPEVPVDALPGFIDGLVSVQDGASQLAAHLLSVEDSHTVLDACAAPGGKTAHILEQTDCTLYAMDKDVERMGRLRETLSRLSLHATLICADAREAMMHLDGQRFDRILLDAPCSATGIIRRHPDIKNHRQPTDIDPLAEEQARLLNNLWPLLKPEGIVLYSTCLILPQENV